MISNKRNIVLIDDDAAMRSILSSVLTDADYKVELAATGQEGLSMLTSQCFDMVLLDLGLLDMDGMDLLLEVRKWSEIPVIIVSSRSDENSIVAAFEAGADDYMVKPVGTRELLARLDYAYRQSIRFVSSKNCINYIYHIDELKVDMERRVVSIDNKTVHLTQNEFRIIALLAKNAGKVMNYEKIISSIWGPYAGKENLTLRVNMANIRKKFYKAGASRDYIVTEVGIGYRMLESK
ncbi:sensor histidine kinase [Lachnospiraceae bacterium KM106-2]|nr:sensor histidine kinase [Lachnospiraceae bacterium KM106-2]